MNTNITSHSATSHSGVSQGAVQVSVAVFSGLTAGSVFGLIHQELSGGIIFTLLAFIAALIFIPSSPTLSGRISLNGVLIFGLLPVLWWGDENLHISQGVSINSFATGLLVAVTVSAVIFTGLRRKQIVPQFRKTDVLLGASAVFMTWLYLPFFQGKSASASLIQGLGGDIVAHFTMVAKTISTGVSGAAWSPASDGTAFVYVNYPQHFHSLAAFFGEGFTRGNIDVIEASSSEFLAGLALTMICAVVILNSLLIESLGRLPGIFLPGLLVIAATASLNAGFGASNIQSGFPNFVLSVVGVLFVALIASQAQHLKGRDLIASAAGLLLVINTWFLLSPIAVGMFVFGLWRYIRHPQRTKKWPPITTSLVIIAAGFAWSLSLINAASVNVGGPVNVLNVPGGTISVPIRFVIGLALITLALSVALFVMTSARGHSDLMHVGFGNAVLVSFSLFLLVALIVLQRMQGQTATYYQLKLANGIFLVLTVVVVVVLVGLLHEVRQDIPGVGRWSAISVMTLAWVGTFLLLSSIPSYITGLEMRVGLAAESQNQSDATQRLMNAALILESMPCEVPVYVALEDDDPPVDIANQWAHALSGTWTESSGPINNYLWSESMEWDASATTEILTSFLDSHPTTCVVVSPSIFETVSGELDAETAQRILTWK